MNKVMLALGIVAVLVIFGLVGVALFPQTLKAAGDAPSAAARSITVSGNADVMVEPDGGPNTAHSTSPVPFVATVPDVAVREGGILADIAPTVLDLLGVPAPSAMTGRDLLVSDGR